MSLMAHLNVNPLKFLRLRKKNLYNMRTAKVLRPRLLSMTMWRGTLIGDDEIRVQMPIFSFYEPEEATLNLDEYITIPPPNEENLVGDHGCTSLQLVNQMLVNDEVIFEEAIPENNIPLFEEEDEDPSEAEEDDPEEMIFDKDCLKFEDPEFVTSIIKSEFLFSAEELEAFLDEKEEDNVACTELGNSFHSTHQSMLSSSAMANHLGGLDMNMVQSSKSNSSKRKTNEGDDDTTSSNLIGAKKPRH